MTDSDQLTREIGHALRDRADAMLGASVSFDGVRGRARSIRRRRAAGTAGTVAAAVAVVLVVPTLLGGADAPRSDRPQPAPPAPGTVPRPAVLHAGSFTLPDGTEADGEQYGCVGLYDVASTTVTARSCTTANLRLSPDGRHVVGGYRENGASARVSVLDRGLRPVLVYAPDQRVVSGATWADDTHLLAAVAGVDGRGWTLESVDLGDGASSTLGGPDDGVPPGSGTEFLFSQ